MQNKWIRFVRGYLVIRLGGDYMERFFNMCRMHNIDLWGIKRENDICICEAYASDFLKMPPLLRKTGTRANVVKKRGLPFYFPFFKKRIIFFVGVILCLAMLNYATRYVWAVEYVGNLQISDDELSDFLEQEGIHYGIKKEDINCEEKEKKLRAMFQNVTWTSIYFEGTKLYIEVKENEKSEPVDQIITGTDIVADEAGTIISIVTRNGVPRVKAGDTVEKGQILVSGGVPVYDESQSIINYQIYDADADIYIRTPIEYTCSIKSSYPVTHYTNNTVHTGFAQILDHQFDLLFLYDFFQKEPSALYETVTEKKQVVLLDNIYLPIYYGEIDRKEYYIQYLTYTQEEMEQKLLDNLEKFIIGLEEKGVQIVEKNVKIVENRNGMELQSDLLVIKPTGIAVEIVTENTDVEEIKE